MDEEPDLDESPSTLTSESDAASHDMINCNQMILPESADYCQTSNIHLPSEHVKQVLIKVYRERVDSIFKIFHWPSLISCLESIDTEQPSQALQSAIYYAALCTLSEDDVEAGLLGDLSELRRQDRAATEQAIAKADLVGRPCLLTLQAFVVYLVSIPD